MISEKESGERNMTINMKVRNKRRKREYGNSSTKINKKKIQKSRN